MSYPLLGTRIVLDEEKILREGKYDLEKMYEMIDELAEYSGLIKIDKHTYHCKGDKNDLACLGIFIHKHLIDYDWFTKNVKSWNWLGDSNDENYVGDLIALLKKENIGVWA